MAGDRRSPAGENTEVGFFFPTTYAGDFEVSGLGVRVVLRAVGAFNAVAQPDDGRLVYREAYRSTDSIHRVESGRSEEILLLRDANAPMRFEYEIVATEGVAQTFEHDGGIRFVDVHGRGIQIEQPWLVDAVGRGSNSAVAWKLVDRRITLTVDVTGLEYPIAVDPSWSLTSQMLSRRSGHSATLLSDGRMLVAGGDLSSEVRLPTCEIYDAASRRWTLTGAMDLARTNHSATLLRNGKVLVVGGKGTGDAALVSAEIYDPNTGQWATTGSLSNARSEHTATLLGTGKVLVVGGVGATWHTSVELYDPTTGQWSSTGSLAMGRASHTSTLVPSGEVLTIGGYNPTALNSVEIYSPATGLWRTTEGISLARYRHTATLLPNGKVLFAGGNGIGVETSAGLYDPVLETGGGSAGNLSAGRSRHSATILPNGKVLVVGGITQTCEVFDSTTGTWSPTAMSLAQVRVGHTATLLPNGKVLVAGGADSFGTLSSVELFDSAVLQRTAAGSMTTPRYYFTATLLPDGKVLVAGGYTVGPVLSSAELFDPSTNSWVSTGSMTKARGNHTATLLTNGKVLVVGGESGSPPWEAELYDPIAQTWQVTEALSDAMTEHSATLLPSGKVLVVGKAGPMQISTAALYDPDTGQWAATAAPAIARWSHTATLLQNGRVLVTGGYGGPNCVGSLRSAELFDPITEEWAQTGLMNSGREKATATLLPDGRVFVAGGTSCSALKSAEIYDPIAGQWILTASMCSAHSTPRSVLLPTGKVLVVGDASGQCFVESEAFDPESGTWEQIGLPTNRIGGVVSILPNGTVLSAGGASSGVLSSADLLDPMSGSSVTRPIISSAPSSIVFGRALSFEGTGFTGMSEASGGGTANSATNYPTIRLQSLVNERVAFIAVDPSVGWSDSAFACSSLPPFTPGPTLVSVVTNGLASNGVVVQVRLLEAPTTLQAVTVSPSRIDLSWVDASPDEAGFKIERRTGALAWEQIASVGLGVTTYTNVGLLAGTTFTYRVRAFNAATEGYFSNEASATTTGCSVLSILQQPVSQTIQAGQSASLFVVATGAEPLAYQWYQQAVGGGFTPIAGATSGVYGTGALVSTTAYRCRVTDACGSVDSAVATVTVELQVTSTSDAGAGSLREAILLANQTDGVETIRFNFAGAGPHVIALATPLPAIEKPVVIDGVTQPGSALGSPKVVLDGSGAGGTTVTCGTDDAGAGADGLYVAAGGAGSVIRGLVINGFTGDGVEFEGGGSSVAASRVEGCFIGTNAEGTAGVTNGRHGIHINNAAYVTVGGDRYPNGSLRYGCLISGNTCSGVEIRGGLAANNLIVGCNIGPDLTGHIPIGNGVGVRVDGAPDNVIGASGDDASKKNRVGFNSGQGTVNTGTVNTGPQGSGPPNTVILGTEFYGNDGEAIDTPVAISPVLSSAQITGTTLTVIGTATVMNASTQYRVQYFTNTTCPTGPSVVGGQGEVLIAGEVLKQSSPAGTLDLTFASSATTARPGELVAVTVTGPEGTSRFSMCEAVEGRLGVVAVETAVVNLTSMPGLRSGPAESGQTSPGLVASFAGPGDPDDPDVGDEPNEVDDAVVPPDAQAAVGPNHLVAVLNTEIAVQSKTDGTFLKRVDLDGFWSALKATPQEVLSAFNPRALYDPYAAGGGRYVIVATANPRQDSSAVLVAVSKTTDPTGDWNLYRYEAETAEVLWADYPTVGFTKDWVAVQVNLFSIGLDQFARTEVFALDKAALYAGTPGVGAGTVLGSRTIGLTQVPAMTYDANQTTLYLLQTGEGNSGGTGKINSFMVTGAVASEILTTGPVYTTTNTWFTPSQTPADLAPQMDTTSKIAVNDTRMHSVVYRNGKLYAAHTVLLPAGGPTPTLSGVQWYELSPEGAVLQSGRVADVGGQVFYAYPSLAVNSQGNMVLGYSRFSAMTYASAVYQFREAGDAAGTLRGEVELKVGEDWYFKLAGDVRNRWGDYSSAAVDPVDDTRLWVLNEYAETPVTGGQGRVSRWGTWWGAVAGSPECTLVCPGNITIGTGPAAPGCGVEVTYAQPTTSGTCGTVTCVPASGSTFPVGTTTVTCTATAGYVCSFTVTVTDTTAPAITCPESQTIASEPNCQAAVPNFVAAAAATDNCPGVVMITQLPVAGTAIGLGTHPVTLTATDAAGNTAMCAVQLTVADQTPPVVSCPTTPIVTAAAAGACSRVVNFPLTVSDNCPGGITVTTSQPSGSEFAVGMTLVTVTATDAAGNVSLPCQFTVTVMDQQSPVIATCPGNIRKVALTSAGRTISYTPPAATDNCGASVSCVPASGSTFAVGTTTVTCTATDAAGNASLPCQFMVTIDPLGTDTAGIYVPATGSWFLRNANSPGGADLVFGYGPANLGWIALSGDWDGNGTDTAGLYDPANGNFFLKYMNEAGGADLVYGFGPAGLGWKPLVGDWDGDGIDTIGLYDPVNGNFFLKNTHAPGAADLVYGFGPAGLGWAPMVGDWDGNGTDTIGLYDPVNGNYFLRNTHAAGGADLVYGFGPAGLGWKPLAGDWNGDGADTVGLYDPATGNFFLRNTHAPGPADSVFGYGPANTTPILGDWNGL